MPTLALPLRSAGRLPSAPARGSTLRLGLGLCSSLLFSYALLDALLRPHAFYDLWLMHAVQPIDVPDEATVMGSIEHLTDSGGAIVAWVVVLAVFAVLRRWIWVCVVALVPIGGIVSLACAAAVARPRPRLDELLRRSLNPEPGSFPSGHAMGAVMLYGLLIAAAGDLRSPVLRATVRLACLTVIAASGFQRVWAGAHWPSDVIGGYALGAGLLACLLTCHARLSVLVTSHEWPRIAETVRAELVTRLPGGDRARRIGSSAAQRGAAGRNDGTNP
jgi:membrane-associated phospholipid phosphatase